MDAGKAPSWRGACWSRTRRHGGSSKRFGRTAAPAGGFDQARTPAGHADLILGDRLPHHFDHTPHFAGRRATLNGAGGYGADRIERCRHLVVVDARRTAGDLLRSFVHQGNRGLMRPQARVHQLSHDRAGDMVCRAEIEAAVPNQEVGQIGRRRVVCARASQQEVGPGLRGAGDDARERKRAAGLDQTIDSPSRCASKVFVKWLARAQAAAEAKAAATCAAFPFRCSMTTGFFFCGMMEEVPQTESGKSTAENSWLTITCMSCANRLSVSASAVAEAVISSAKSRLATQSSPCSSTASKPRRLATSVRSIGKLVVASAAAPIGDRLTLFQASSSRPTSRASAEAIPLR